MLVSGGDNLFAALSPEILDDWIYVVDVAGGDKVPRKGGPGACRSSLLVIHQIDLAGMVCASLEVMDHDSKKMRGTRPFLFPDLKSGSGLDQVVAWVMTRMRVNERRALGTIAAPLELAPGGHNHCDVHSHSHLFPEKK